MPQNTQPNQPVVVKKVVVVKKKRSLVQFLLATVALLIVVILIGAVVAFSAWMYTYKALTQEKVVGELYISGKVIKDGVPTYRVRYVPLEEQNALGFSGPEDGYDKEVRADMSGDQVFVDANFVRWENWITLVGVQPVYKVYRVKSDYKNIDERNQFRSSAFDLNGGSDSVIENFSESDKTLDWLIQSAFISSAGQNVTDEDQVFNVVVTKDAIVLERKS